MPSRILDITSDAHQAHTLLFIEDEIALELRFLPVVERWFMSVTYKTKSALGVAMACSTLHMRSRNFPFDFAVRDTTRTGLDPFRLEDFSSGRCELYLMDEIDMAAIRGVTVEL